MIQCFCASLYQAEPIAGTKDLSLYLPFENNYQPGNDVPVNYDTKGAVDFTDGFIGRGIKLSGTDAQITFNKLNMDIAKGTVIFYFKALFSPQEQGNFLFFNTGSGSIDLYYACGKSGVLQFRAHSAEKVSVLNNWVEYGFIPNEWNLIALTWDCQKGMILYINGIKKKENPGSWNPKKEISQDLFFMVKKGNLSGIIDEYHIYNKSFSPEEIAKFCAHMPKPAESSGNNIIKKIPIKRIEQDSDNMKSLFRKPVEDIPQGQNTMKILVNGQTYPLEEIVTSDNMNNFTRESVLDFKKILMEASGCGFQLSGHDKSSSKKIYIGEACADSGLIADNDMKKITEGGYLIKTADGNVLITGSTWDGTISGLYAFLEALGVKFLSREVIVYPRDKTTEIKELRN